MKRTIYLFHESNEVAACRIQRRNCQLTQFDNDALSDRFDDKGDDVDWLKYNARHVPNKQAVLHYFSWHGNSYDCGMGLQEIHI